VIFFKSFSDSNFRRKGGDAMQPELFQGFERQIICLTNALASERSELKEIEDREAATIKRHYISGLERMLAVVTESRDSIIAAECDVATNFAKFAKWRELFAAARDARNAVEIAAKPIEAAQVDCDNAESSYFHAARELSGWVEKPLDGYASEPEKARWDAERSRREGVVNEKSLGLRKLKTKLALLRTEWLEACKTFERVSFSERMSRLPEPTQQPKIQGSVSRVA
jgi:hypothetical protein